MNASDRRSLGDRWRRLTLWPRLAIGVTIGFVVLFAGFSVLGIRAVDSSTNRILHERLAITEELAQDFDGLLEHRFADLEAFDTQPAPTRVQRRLLAEIYHAGDGAFTTLSLLDRSGRVRMSLGKDAAAVRAQLARTHFTPSAHRTLSAPFRDAHGRPLVALAVPLRRGGVLGGSVVGTIDLAGPDVTERLDAAERLGTTGHAELVGPGGVALASTEAGPIPRVGEHLAFYRKMLASARPAVEDVPVTPNQHEPRGLGSERHVMAFVRLTDAPWGVALGGTESDTYAPARRLRRTLILAGGGSLAALWLLTLFAARLLVRPVRGLTSAAEAMASGDLEHEIAVSEGGEIGVLGESLEAMRVQLRDSLETVRRWGEELELKVSERTAELNARNRQLAAVSAIVTTANETHDLEEMLNRCLDVVLEQTGMDAAAVRLEEVSLAAGDGDLLARRDGVTVLPLRAPGGTVGELAVARRGPAPDEEERRLLAAICDQLGVAIENARLATELRRLEARHEVQRLRSELISAVSHELRTPLGFIKGYATTLLREDTPIPPELRTQFLRTIDEETDKLDQMIDELLDASRLQAGRLPIEREPVRLGALLAGIVEKARPMLADGHELRLEVPPEDPLVLADALRIEQVLDNLLENAARYSRPDSPIDVGLVREDGRALVSVTDRGDGIPEAELEQIFEPFYRGQSSRERRIRGTGLGLAICRGIVEAHGGTIWAESMEGGATTFLFSLPVAP